VPDVRQDCEKKRLAVKRSRRRMKPSELKRKARWFEKMGDAVAAGFYRRLAEIDDWGKV